MNLSRRTVSELPLSSEVHKCSPDTTIREVIELLQEHRIGCLIVVERDDTVVGIFTERDILNKIAGFEESRLKEPISKFMTPNPKSVTRQDPILKAILCMRFGRFRHVVVVKDENKLDTVISIKDVMDFALDALTSSVEQAA